MSRPLVRVQGLQVFSPGNPGVTLVQPRVAGSGDASNNATIELVQGQVVALTGPSGVGKSSLLRGLVHLNPMNATTFEVDGVPVPHTPAGIRLLRRQLTYVPQTAIPFPGTARANCLHACWLAGLPATPAHLTQADEALATVALPVECWDQEASTLSIGQRMRLAIARALMIAEHVLLLDEPFAALDPEARTALREGLRRWVAAGPRALVAVVHDPALMSGWATLRWTLRDATTLEISDEVAA